ncbi:MAG: hypothetical protein EBV03_07960, partial [Proteobacteria bacterium]|nr:hypothetical protein [Pseudomonadota bacterium]
MKIPSALLTPGIKHIARLTKGGEAFFLQHLLEQQRRVLYITTSDAAMNALATRLRFFLPEVDVLTLPAWDCLPYDRVSPSIGIVQQRIETLSRIASPHTSTRKEIILTTVNAALQRIPEKTYFSTRALALKVGDAIDRDTITHFLAGNGYNAVASAAEPGEFALRGSIIDIVPTFGVQGFRLDFFGNELESIRGYEPLTQISTGRQNALNLLPASEVSLDVDSIARFQKNYRSLFGEKSTDDPLYASVSAACKYAGMEHWLPLYHASLSDIFAYMPDALVCLDSEVLSAKEERLELIEEHYENRKKNRAESMEGGSSYKPVAPDAVYVSGKEWDSALATHASLVVHSSDMPDESVAFNCGQNAAENLFAKAKQESGSAFDMLKPLLGKDKKVWLACATLGSLERIKHILGTHEIPTTEAGGWNPNSKPSVHTLSLL